MPRLFSIVLFTYVCAQTALAHEHVILTGGPALIKWESYRVESERHDRWWANFIRASTLHMDHLKAQYGDSESITWYVYKKGYTLRGKEDQKPYTSWIKKQATKRKATLVWINSGEDFIKKFNQLPTAQTKTFHFFGHSNKHCFLLDYSADILGVSTAWIHETELSKLSAKPFAQNAICKSWGCHSGESMNKYWQQSTRQKLIGAKGKTDYTPLSFGKMPKVNGRWIK